MEGSSKGKVIFNEEESSRKRLLEMSPYKLFLDGNNISTSSAATRATIDLTNSARIGHDQAPRPNLGPNYDQNMDPRRLRRIMSNRLSAQRSRIKMMQYVSNLEIQAKGFETHIAKVVQQIIFYQNMKQHLIVEKHVLGLKMEALEEATQIKSVEIERNQAEATVLRELYRMQEEGLLTQMYNWDNSFQPVSTDMQSMSYDPSNFFYPNLDQEFQVEQNGKATSFMNTDMPQNYQSQTWMPTAMPIQNQTNMTLPQMDDMNTNLMNNNNEWNPNLDNGFN